MRSACFILLIILKLGCFGQDLPLSTQQQLENTAESLEENIKDDQLLQQLDYFKKHPINLNTAATEELQSLQLLSDLQISNLIRYRKLLGNLVSIYELQAIPSWNLPTIQKILPYVIVGNAQSVSEDFRSRFQNADQTILFGMIRVLEKAKGYDTSLNNHYLGDPNHLQFRYRYQFKDLLYFGLTADKDAGEPFFKGAQSKGFDFYSFHFFVRKLGIIKSIAIGDYTVNLGQGLIQWQSLAFGKTAEVMSVKRQSPVLMPYRSAGEFYFNRGLGITLQKQNLEATVFASHKKISGNISNDTAEKFTSIQTSGYYRTPAEIADKNQISLTSIGGAISYQTASFKIGWNTVAHQFGIPLQKRDEPYNLYAISGRKIFNSSADYSCTYKNFHLFGEAAIDKDFHKAFINGLLVSADPKLDLSILYRNIQKEYQSLFGNAFTENTVPVNERGIYTGVTIRPVSGWQINAYADLFQFPWIKYRVNEPSNGYGYLIQINYQPGKKFGMYAQYKNKNKPIDSSGNGVIDYPGSLIKQSLRVHLFQQLASDFSMNSRVELIWLHQGNNQQQGFAGYIEGRYQRKKLAADFRLLYFETDSYDSRVYSYESDVLYSFSIPAFYDKGFRYYLNFRYRVTSKFQLWVRGAQTINTLKNKIGSGLDEINGNKKTELKIQGLFLF